MSVDVFGRKLGQRTETSSSSSRGPPGIGFKITIDGQYDLEDRRLCNVAEPINTHDAVNLAYLEKELNILRGAITEIQNRRRKKAKINKEAVEQNSTEQNRAEHNSTAIEQNRTAIEQNRTEQNSTSNVDDGS